METTGSGYRLVVRDPRIHGGESVIRGTRVPIRSIILSLQDDYPGDPPSRGRGIPHQPRRGRSRAGLHQEHQAEIDRIVEQHERAAHDH